MLLKNILFCLASLSLVLSYPVPDTSSQDGRVVARGPKAAAPAPVAKAPPSKPNTVEQYDGTEVSANVPRFASIPNNPRKSCKKVTDCHCPKPANRKVMHNTSCINGFCQCDNPVVNLIGSKFMEAVAAIGNAPITKAVGALMKGLATVKQVAGTIVGAFLPAPAKAALKVALNALPDTGPSFLDDAKKKVLTKGL